MKNINIADYQYLIGKTIDEAKVYIPDVVIRCARFNGEPTICTRDFKRERLNVSVTDGKIDEIMGWG